MILLIDNYDSFTYNLYQAIGQLYEDITVIRNDKLTIEQIQNMQPEAIIISPGPGYPKDAGISVAVIEKFSGTIPILGVCLGHQSIAQAFGGDVIHAKQLMHGKASTITVNGTTIQLDSATNLYYSIKNAIGTDKVVTITNTGDGMVALTNLKATGGTATLNLYSSQAAVGKVLAAMQMPGTGNQ